MLQSSRCFVRFALIFVALLPVATPLSECAGVRRRLATQVRRSPLRVDVRRRKNSLWAPFIHSNAAERAETLFSQSDAINQLKSQRREVDVALHPCHPSKELPAPPPLVCLPHELLPFTTTSKHPHFYDTVVCRRTSSANRHANSFPPWLEARRSSKE